MNSAGCGGLPKQTLHATGQMGLSDDCGVSEKSRHTMTGHLMLREIKLIPSFYLKCGKYSLPLMCSSGAEMPFCCSDVICWLNGLDQRSKRGTKQLTVLVAEHWCDIVPSLKTRSDDLMWTEENSGAWWWPESEPVSSKLISLFNINKRHSELWLHKG